MTLYENILKPIIKSVLRNGGRSKALYSVILVLMLLRNITHK